MKPRSSIYIVVAIAFAAALNPSIAAAAIRPNRELWLISTRSVGSGPACDDTARLRAWRFDGVACRWQEATLAAFLADEQSTTCFYAHGNRISAGAAFQQGQRVYERLACYAPQNLAWRLVIWSWPADQIRGPLRDVRVKADRSEYQAYHLARLIDRLPPQMPVSLVGFSYGARLDTGALHLLAGGRLPCGPAIALAHPHRAPLSVAIFAAAVDSDWLLPGHRHGGAYNEIESLANFINGADPVLKRYHRLYGLRRGPEAMGYVGIYGARGRPVAQPQVTGVVGRQHAWEPYIASNYVMSRIAPYAFYLNATPTSARARAPQYATNTLIDAHQHFTTTDRHQVAVK